MSALRLLVLVLCIFPALFALLFAGGLLSAWLEIRRERAAGLVPTRPGWEHRDKARAIGSRRERVRVWYHRARARRMGLDLCWCGRGALREFPATDSGSQIAGIGCAAWEAVDLIAIQRHDAAGGYARVPVTQ